VSSHPERATEPQVPLRLGVIRIIQHSMKTLILTRLHKIATIDTRSSGAVKSFNLRHKRALLR